MEESSLAALPICPRARWRPTSPLQADACWDSKDPSGVLGRIRLLILTQITHYIMSILCVSASNYLLYNFVLCTVLYFELIWSAPQKWSIKLFVSPKSLNLLKADKRHLFPCLHLKFNKSFYSKFHFQYKICPCGSCYKCQHFKEHKFIVALNFNGTINVYSNGDISIAINCYGEI